MTRKEWTLAAISLGKANGLTPAQLQKVLFLLSKSYPSDLRSFYNFSAYNYGPFDKTIYQDAEALAVEGLIELVENSGNTWSYYSISPQGKEKVKGMITEENPRPYNYLKKLVDWAQSLTFEQLISSVYEKYPEYKVNSVFKS